MPAINVAIQLRSLKQPLQRGLQTAARLGVRAVEIDGRGEINPRELSATGLRQFKKKLEDLNLRVAAVGFQTRRGYDVAEGLEARVAATKAAMSFAYSLGARIVVNQVGRVPADANSAQWRLTIEALTDLGGHGQHVGAMLAAETGSESAADLKRLFDALPAGSLAIALNPGNLIINGFSPGEAIAALGAEIQYVRAKDGVHDRARGRGVEVPLGRGEADFPALIGGLEEHNYRGYYCVERDNAANPEFELGQAVQYLKSL